MQKQLPLLLLTIIILASNTINAYAQFLTLPPSGDNKKAAVSEEIGITRIAIDYSRPGVRGREGKIWGQVVPYSFQVLGYGSNNPSPWRAGANEMTTIEFSSDVMIDGKPLKAGKYGLLMAVQEKEVTVIFSNNTTNWGGYFYDEKEDALRITVKQEVMPNSVEWLKYEFIDQTPNSATVALFWEKWKIPFKITVDVNATVVASMRLELRGDDGFSWQAMHEAALWCLQNNTNLEEALVWADKAINEPFIGDANFQTISTKAMILEKLGKGTEATALMKTALDKGNPAEIHNYARQLMMQKRTKEAAEVFRFNAKKYPNQWPVNVGLMRAYSSEGNFKDALKYAKLALEQAPDDLNKQNLQRLIQLLNEGKDINQ
ncbi:MAG: DUF2911 domain-containing protein [Cytophagales bacterium]|nr:MAG: DUF2911 domain-containing protein [Cytophagales bacterium]